MHTIIPKRFLLGLYFTCLILILPENSLSADNSCNASGQISATYVSSNGALLKACFDQNTSRVKVQLPDSTTVNLPIAISGSGSRYSDGNRTFWEHQRVGRYFVGEKLIFEGAVDTTDEQDENEPSP